MFTQFFPVLMSHYRTDALELPRPVGTRRARAESDALEALRREPAALPLSARLRNPEEYQALQRRRRDDLLALLLAEPVPDVLERIVDLIAAIVEEITWSANPDRIPFEDENHPEIDVQSAETAVLFGWTVHLLGERLDASVSGRMRSEVRRRFFRPALVHDDYGFMRGEAPCPMTIASDLLLSALLLENDEARLGRLLRPALKLLDECCGRHGRELAPLAETVSDISAVSDLTRLLRDMTRQYVDLSGSIPTGDWLDEILYAWIQDDLFNDPAGDGMQPPLSGCDVFRIGEAASDQPLIDLGAHLHHRSHRPPATVTGRLLEPSVSDRLESTFGKPQRLRYAALRNNLLMATRVPGLYCSMHVGGRRGNAGDICLFADGAPILVDGGRGCSVRNLPVIAGREPLEAPSRPCIADFQAREDQEMMSVDLTHAYPAACGLRSYQRTALTLRAEHTVRIVDAVDLERPATVAFRFVAAARPTVLSAAIRFGSVRMTWEGDFTISAKPMENGLTCIELIAVEPVRQAFFAFNFERA